MLHKDGDVNAYRWAIDQIMKVSLAPEHTWRKSRRSQNSQNCVELRKTLDQMRDSKNVTGPALRANVPVLLRAIQASRFDH